MSVDEIYAGANASLLPQIREDRRLQRKPATYQVKGCGESISMWANTVPEGGIIVLGMENEWSISGCLRAGITHINKLERVGDVYCPDARYESKRVIVQNSKGTEGFLTLLRVYYHPKKSVRTSSGDAFIRRGESKVRFSESKIRELEIGKGQVEFEQELTDFIYPQDFDIELIRQYTNIL